ncbi:MAG: hypothetical protein JXO49_04325 [Deltaproteobacteria bacterium]|nr:hypothetical protein [Candidatus Anaeroferrophillus wilburensis]MBN2888555.1 hypothetical protein [Deltaproteobacteria bacterium]
MTHATSAMTVAVCRLILYTLLLLAAPLAIPCLADDQAIRIIYSGNLLGTIEPCG